MGILENIHRLENIREKIQELRKNYIKLNLSTFSSENNPSIPNGSSSSIPKQMAVKTILKLDSGLHKPNLCRKNTSSINTIQSHSIYIDSFGCSSESSMDINSCEENIKRYGSSKKNGIKTNAKSTSYPVEASSSKARMVTTSIAAKSMIAPHQVKTSYASDTNDVAQRISVVQKKVDKAPLKKSNSRFFAKKSTQANIPQGVRPSSTTRVSSKSLQKDSKNVIFISDSDEEMQIITSGTSTPEPSKYDGGKIMKTDVTVNSKHNHTDTKRTKAKPSTSYTDFETDTIDNRRNHWKGPEVVIPLYHRATEASHGNKKPKNEVIIEIDSTESLDASRAKLPRKRKVSDSIAFLNGSSTSKRPTKATKQSSRDLSSKIERPAATLIPYVVVPQKKVTGKQKTPSIEKKVEVQQYLDISSRNHPIKDTYLGSFEINYEDLLFPKTLELDISPRSEFTSCPTRSYSYVQDKRKHITPQLLDTTQLNDRQLLSFLNDYTQICREQFDVNAHESLAHIDRPYLSLKARERLTTSNLSSLQTGDIIHYPFTQKEKDVLLANISLGWNKLSKLLPGRKPSDCRRFHNDLKSEQLRDELTNPLVYIQTIDGSHCKKETRPKKTLNSLIRHRETGMVSQYIRTYDEPLLRGMELIASFSISSGAVIDTSLHQSTRTLLGVACVTNDDPTYNKPNNLLLGDVDSASIHCLNQHYTNQTNRRHYSTVTDVKFSSDGKCMYSSSFDTTAKIWSTESGELKASTDVHSKRVNRMAIPKNKHYEIFATGSDDGLIGVYPVNTELGLLAAKANILSQRKNVRIVSDLDFCSGMFDHLLVGAYEGTRTSAAGMIIVWDYQTGKRVHQFTDMLSSVSCIQSSPTGNLIVSGSSGGTYVEEVQPSGDQCVRVFDLRTNSQVQTANTNQSDINLVTFSPDETFITSSGTENRTLVYDRRFCDAPIHVLNHEEPTGGIRHDGVISLQWVGADMLLTGGGDSLVKLWSTTQAEPCIHSFGCQDSPVSSLSITPDHGILAVGTISGSVYLYSSDQTYRSRENQWTVIGDE